jgi:hypothetical protein
MVAVYIVRLGMVGYKASGKRGKRARRDRIVEFGCLTIGDTCPKGQLTGPNVNRIMSI